MNEDNRQARKIGLGGILMGALILAPTICFYQPLSENPNKITPRQYLSFSGTYISSAFLLTGVGLYTNSLISDLLQRRRLKKAMKSANYQKTEKYQELEFK